LSLSVTLAAAGASAQTFETVFGPPGTVEQGARRVKPVEVCPDEGFIAVGTTTGASSPSDVYVVRTKSDGNPMWELHYDIGPGGNDRGQALAEARDGSGFIIVGTSRRSATARDHVFLLKIRCDGSPSWAQTYESNTTEAGFDVVEARSGNAAFGTQKGDILVAGYAANPLGNRDALLFRARSDGTLIWNHRYDYNNAHELFRALTETSPIAGASPTGDVVAVGLFAAPTGALSMAYAVRVSGDTGLIGAAPQNAVVYQTPDSQSFESVVELRASALSGNLVMTGTTRNSASGTDILLTRTGPDPLAFSNSERIGDPVGGPYGEEAALDLHEVTNPLTIAGPGQLALTGRVGRSGTPEADAFLLVADPGSLEPAAIGRLFGDHGPGRDIGVSVHDHSKGFVISGLSDSDFEGVGDPRDLYLIGADDSGKTDCVLDWEPRFDRINADPQRVFPEAIRFLDPVRRDVKVERHDSPFPACR
jgi:hypothetical protein